MRILTTLAALLLGPVALLSPFDVAQGDPEALEGSKDEPGIAGALRVLYFWRRQASVDRGRELGFFASVD